MFLKLDRTCSYMCANSYAVASFAQPLLGSMLSLHGKRCRGDGLVKAPGYSTEERGKKKRRG